MRRRLAVACAVLALGLAGCASAGSSSAGDTGFVAGDGSVVEVAAADRVAAPSFSGTTLDGSTLSSADLIGKVAVLNVWASWCAPCRSEAPELAALAKELGSDDVAFVGLDTRDSTAAATAFVKRFDIGFPSIVDADGSIQLLFHDTLPPQAIPSTLVLDRQGRVAARFLGVVEPSSLKAVVTSLTAEPT